MALSYLLPRTIVRQVFARQQPACIRCFSSTTTRSIFSTPTSRIVPTTTTTTTSLFKYNSATTFRRTFSATATHQATYNQVRRGCRKPQKARRRRSPALANRPQMKGVCLKTGITKPKKPNSGERKTARVRLSSGRVVTAYIPGEGKMIYISSWLVRVRVVDG